MNDECPNCDSLERQVREAQRLRGLTLDHVEMLAGQLAEIRRAVNWGDPVASLNRITNVLERGAPSNKDRR